MDLMKTLLVYMSLVFSSSVVTAPLPSNVPPAVIVPTPTVAAATPSPTPKSTQTLKPTQTPRPTPDITPSVDYKTLSIGSKGESVKKLQRRLAELGYLTGTVDGAFGNQTKRAVERFQYYNGLSVDGVAGQRTQTILYESTEVVFAPVDVTPTPSPKPTNTAVPTATVGPTPTIFVTSTPAPTAVPTATVTTAPTPTAAPTDAPVASTVITSSPEVTQAPVQSPELTQEPTSEPTPTGTPIIYEGIPVPVDNSSIYVNEGLLINELGENVLYYQRGAGDVLIPFTTLSRLMTWVTVIDNGNMDQYTVEASGYLLGIAYVKDELGNVSQVDFQVDGLPVELPQGQAIVFENELYVTPLALQTLLNVQWNLAQDAPVLYLTITPKATQTSSAQG